MTNFVINMEEVFNSQGKVIITCNRRLVDYLKDEVEALGFTPKRVFNTGLELWGSLNDCIKLNLNLRTGSQVLYKLKDFQADDPDQLHRELVKVPWEKYIPEDSYFSVTSNVHNETITTPLFANVRVKDAVVDRMKEKFGTRPNSGPDNDKIVLHLHWIGSKAEIFLDTSGQTLAKHGYRLIPGAAPMQESLASACIAATQWDRKTPFINPMCGSGTLAIEAALLATNKTPGLLRMNYGFMHLLGYDEEVFFEERRLLKAQVNKENIPPIIATDISRDAVEVSKANAKTAGVEHLIQFEVCDFADTQVPEEPGVIIFNPEYGERLGVHKNLERTYGRIGDFMKQKCAGYKGYVFTGNPDLAKKIGLRASRRFEFYNGKLDCRLLQYELYKGTTRKDG